MVKPLTFKGDKRPSKKRKRSAVDDAELASSTALSAADPPANEDDDDSSWVSPDAASDITGPIVIVLPTLPPSALSCDVTGQVFAIPIENIVDDNPATAEPHDVRQVWVATRVAGTEGFNFKGHHGKYLAADSIGSLSARREAVGREEEFEVEDGEGGNGVVTLKTMGGKCLGVEKGEVRADLEEGEVRVKMQARFKPRLKVAKEERRREKVSRKELERLAGRRLEEEDVKRLKRARKEGNFHEVLLDVKVKGKHDKFA